MSNASTNFKVYRTSAGGGKTYTLVKEFITGCISNNNEIKSSLAITFTNKAANEMKERIIEALYKIAYQNNEELISLIANETNKSHTDVVQNCREILNKILYQYYFFSVSTIDSFIHNILRSFSLEMKLPNDFKVEIDDEVFIDLVVDKIYEKITSDEKLKKYLTDFSIQKLNEEDEWDITRLLRKYTSIIFTENYTRYAPKNYNDYQTTLIKIGDRIQNLCDEIKNIASEAINEIHNNLKKQNFKYAPHSIDVFFEKYRGYNCYDEITLNSRQANENKWFTNKPDIELINFLKAKRDKILEIYKELIYLHILKDSFENMTLLSTIEQCAKEVSEENSTIPISFFNKYIYEIISDETVPFIYERLGLRYINYLIDEFQDTSLLQWHNLLPLVHEALSSNQNSKVFLVGDTKQSIYRFRNSEMYQLAELPKIYKGETLPQLKSYENSLKNSFTSVEKGKKSINYRSAKNIVEFNNIFFEYISYNAQNQTTGNNASNPTIKKIYENLRQEAFKGEDKGLVVFYLINKSKQQSEEISYIDQTLRQIEEIIRQKRARIKDITILVRQNEKGRLIAEHLMNLPVPIPVISSESLAISFSPKVNAIVDTIKILINNKDLIAIASLYTFLKKRQKVKTISFYDLLKNSPFEQLNMELKNTGFEINWEKLKRLTLSKVVSELIKSFGFNQIIDPYILFFENAVIDFEKENQSNLMHFIEWWEEKGKNKSIVVSEGTEAVRIMSIHKAKGLEFPIVIYPFADYVIKRSEGAIWINSSKFPEQIPQEFNLPENIIVDLKFKKSLNDPTCRIKQELELESDLQMIENLNIHYVAMTRAIDEIHIITKEDDKNNKDLIPRTLDKLINKFIKDNENLFKKVENQDNITIYIYPENGKISINEEKTSSSHKNENDYELKKYEINDTRDRLKVKILSELSSREQEIGTLFHEFISILNEKSHLENIDELFNSFVAKNNLNENTALELKSYVNASVNNTSLRSLFYENQQVLSEVEIMVGDKIYRLDKIFVGDKQIVIVEFKTGEKTDKHKEQLKNYINVLKKVDNFENKEITGLLIYVNKDFADIVSI